MAHRRIGAGMIGQLTTLHRVGEQMPLARENLKRMRRGRRILMLRTLQRYQGKPRGAAATGCETEYYRS
jgi:hypothetical protein